MKKIVYIFIILIGVILNPPCATGNTAKEVKWIEDSPENTRLKVLHNLIYYFAEWVDSESYMIIDFRDYLYVSVYTKERESGDSVEDAKVWAEAMTFTLAELEIYEDKRPLIKKVDMGLYTKLFYKYITEGYGKEDILVYMVDNDMVSIEPTSSNLYEIFRAKKIKKIYNERENK
jgi:hypothetical protein